MDRNLSGFREISHTADWALQVWAPDLTGLLVQAAQGMFSLMEIQIDPRFTFEKEIKVTAEDAESLLVSFLSELLFLCEMDGLGFNQFNVKNDGLELTAIATGAKIVSQRKEIKAVTYHNLEIRSTETGLEAVIVFDV
jgi:SHS2 domain-containing protein